MLTPKDIVGEWMLNAFDIQKPGGMTIAWGENTHGILIYTANGYMSVSINKEDALSKSGEDMSKTILFYAGTYEIDHMHIIHHVKNASDVNRIGKDMIREATLEDNRLTMIGRGDFGTAILSWVKILASHP